MRTKTTDQSRKHRRRLGLLGLAVWASPAMSAEPQPPGESSGRFRSQVVHRFDFDELARGNMEEFPMYWEALRPADFPAFASGRFDRSVGRTAPPSFYLASAGRNVAYGYGGPDTRVHPGANYRVEGYIRADRLKHARAFVGVHFVDREGGTLLDTLVRSRYVGGEYDANAWVGVEFSLPPAPPEAYSIGLTAWVLQEDLWNPPVDTRRPIEHRDVNGGAWFDDITVYRLPLVRLSTTVPGNVLAADDPPQLIIHLNDPEMHELTGELTLRNAEQETVMRAVVQENHETTGEPHRVDVGSLPPGLYHVGLTVMAKGGGVDSRSLSFVILGSSLRSGEAIPKSFGLVMEEGIHGTGEAELSLLRRQGVRSLKYPVWEAWGRRESAFVSGAALDGFLGELSRRGVSPTAVLGGPPRSIAQTFRTQDNPLMEVLSSGSRAWTEDLAKVAAPYAGVFRWWQIGADEGPLPDRGDRFSTAAENLRSALRRFITAPRLSAVRPSSLDADSGKLPVEQMTVALGPDVDTDWLAPWFRGWTSLGYDQVSVFIAPPSDTSFRRVARLAEWSQRILAARHAGANTVYVPQTWHLREEMSETVAEPTEEFIVLHTLADVLGESRPGPRWFVHQGVRCLAFETGNHATLAMWDEEAPAEGRIHVLQLGRASRQIDLWGRTTPLERSPEGLHRVRLSALPTFVDGVDRWLVDLVYSVALTPAMVESGSEIVRHVLSIGGAGVPGLSGQVSVEVPAGLVVSPNSFPFRTSTNEVSEVELTVRYPHTEPAGRKPILVRLAVGPEGTVVEVPLFVEVGLSDVEVAGTAVLEGDDLILQHVVSNRSLKNLDFRGSAGVPGRERQYRPLSNLGPGETQMIEYRFARAGDLAGRRVRLMLRELNDGPRTHTLELAIR